MNFARFLIEQILDIFQDKIFFFTERKKIKIEENKEMKENERKRENTYDTRGPLFNRAHASAAFFQSIGSPGVDIGGVGLCDGVDL